tara:strand:+ start:820 stop:2850 length:2031 start_codon:yes stop_codon:yes gene_type:complete
MKTKKNVRQSKKSKNNHLIPAEEGGGWYSWRSALAKFYKTPPLQLNILEVGCYQGEATSWFLRNLCQNSKSRMYAIDTFEGSPEYVETDFISIKEAFYRNIQKTGKDSQVTVMETTSYLGLIELNKQNKSKPFLDIIFIDASHEAADVMSDGVLSFPLLKEGGVMIFDDYIWEKLVQKHYQPKLAIDAFLDIMKPYVKIIKKGRQILLEKTPQQDSQIATDLIDIYYKNIITPNVLKLEKCNPPKTKKEVLLQSKDNFEIAYQKDFQREKILFNKFNSFNINENYLFHLTLNIFCTSNKKIYDSAVQKKKFIHFKEMLTNTYFSKKWNELKIRNWHYLYFYRYIKLMNLYYEINSKRALSFLNFRFAYDFSGTFFSNKELDKLFSYTSYFSKSDIFESRPNIYHDISCTTNYEKFGDSNLDTNENRSDYRWCKRTCLNLWSIKNLISIINSVKNKISILNLSLNIPASNYLKEGKLNLYLEKIKCYEIQTYLSVVFALCVQEKNGVACIVIPNSEIQTTFCKQSISLITMYYENVNLVYYINNGDKLLIYAQGFKGITSKIQETLINNCQELQSQHTPNGKIKNNMLGIKVPLKLEKKIEEWNRLIFKNKKIHFNYLETIYPNLKLPLHHNKDLIDLLTQYQIRFYITWCKENMEEYYKLIKIGKNHKKQNQKKKL